VPDHRDRLWSSEHASGPRRGWHVELRRLDPRRGRVRESAKLGRPRLDTRKTCYCTWASSFALFFRSIAVDLAFPPYDTQVNRATQGRGELSLEARQSLSPGVRGRALFFFVPLQQIGSRWMSPPITARCAGDIARGLDPRSPGGQTASMRDFIFFLFCLLFPIGSAKRNW
jgi:hypothetical protein